MGITATSGLGSGPSSDATRGSNELGKDQFVQLLMAQLRNQDPTSPVDSQAFVAQLAQFSSLEQMQGMSSRLDALVLAQAASNQTQTADLVGKDVLFKTDRVELPAVGGTVVSGELSAEAASVTVTISDEDGKTVRTLKLGPAEAGAFDIPWDGRDEAGVPLPAGEYTVKLAAADLQGDSVDIESRGKGFVGGVSFANGYPELMVGGRKIKLSDVLEIVEPSAEPAAGAEA
jgi:flagellar basal-body rod modification protein FlgD